jgi:hypothetical protein
MSARPILTIVKLKPHTVATRRAPRRPVADSLPSFLAFMAATISQTLNV